MVDRVEFEEFHVPATLDDEGGRDFVHLVELQNAVIAEAIGSHDFSSTAEELLPAWRNTIDEPKRVLLARADDLIVGLGVLDLPPQEGSTTAYVAVAVRAEYREAGIGTTVHDRLESWAREDGRSVLQAWVTHGAPREGEQLEPPTGFGSIAAGTPEVRFASARGYRLEQVERMSRLDLVRAAPLLAARRLEAARHADGYVVETYAGEPPVEVRDDLAILQQRMSTDVPAAGLTINEEPWDAARVARIARERADGRLLVLTAAARRSSTGRLVGFTELLVPADRRRPVVQESTLVLSEHRGHRLGMLLKVVNLEFLLAVSPESTVVTTYNAEENRPMLAVNEALGFEAVGAEGAWRKDA